MVVTPLNADLQTLPTQSYYWPLWLKDGESWCLGIAPLWLLVADETTLTRYERQVDLSYQQTPLNEDLLTCLKKLFLATPCPAYPLTLGFTGGLMGWMSYPNSSRALQYALAFMMFLFVLIMKEKFICMLPVHH